MSLYTKNGRPLQVSDSTVYSKTGKVVGRINDDRVYGTDGHHRRRPTRVPLNPQRG